MKPIRKMWNLKTTWRFPMKDCLSEKDGCPNGFDLLPTSSSTMGKPTCSLPGLCGIWTKSGVYSGVGEGAGGIVLVLVLWLKRV